MSDSSIVVPVATFVGGSALTVALQWWRDRVAREERNAEREGRDRERKEDREERESADVRQQLERHRDRQRSYLTELQDELLEMARLATRVHLQYLADLEQTGAARRIPDDLDEALASRLRRVYVLTSRVDGSQIRSSVSELVELAGVASGIHKESAEEAYEADVKFGLKLERTNMAIGRQLRLIEENLAQRLSSSIDVALDNDGGHWGQPLIIGGISRRFLDGEWRAGAPESGDRGSVQQL